MSPDALGTWRGPAAVPSAGLPRSSALQQPAFSLFVFLPLRAILSLPYAVIITSDNLTAALLFQARQSHAPPPSLLPTAPGQCLGSSNQGFLQFLPLGRIWTLFPSVAICLPPAHPSITKGGGAATSMLPWRKLRQQRDAPCIPGEGQQRGGEGDFLVYRFYYHASTVTRGVCYR